MGGRCIFYFFYFFLTEKGFSFGLTFEVGGISVWTGNKFKSGIYAIHLHYRMGRGGGISVGTGNKFMFHAIHMYAL